MITLAEFRAARMQRVMARENLDVMVASLPEHILYMLGFTILGATYQAKTQNYAVYSPGNNKEYLVISPSDAPTALDFSKDIELVCHGGFHFDFSEQSDAFMDHLRDKIAWREASPADALVEAIRRCGGKQARIGIDELRTPVTTWNKVAAAFPNAELVPALALFEEIRCVKHPDEIDLIEKATNIAEDSLLAALDRTCMGASEYDMGMQYRTEVASRFGNGYFCTCTVDKRTAFSDTCHKKDARISDGSIIRFDYGAIYEHFRSDLARTVMVGKGNPKAEKQYAYLLEGIIEAEACMKPGIPASAVYEAAVRAVRRGIPDYQRHHCGHGIGLQIYDPLPITAQSHGLLEEGMVFCIETPYYKIGEYGLQIEDTVTVTACGIRRLARTSNELIRIL